MPGVIIPPWNGEGLLPPINPASPATFDRSPYQVSLKDLVLRFATSPERKAILSGFLRYRAALHEIGLVKGFQWIDGSFLENIESLEGRDPQDLDVVTFFHIPPRVSPEKLLAKRPRLFYPSDTKADFRVDAYYVRLTGAPPEELVWQSAYWYSMWSHRRGGQWKGYLEINLSFEDDEGAQNKSGEIK